LRRNDESEPRPDPDLVDLDELLDPQPATTNKAAATSGIHSTAVALRLIEPPRG
jgi:hypothetical protein